jgi:hypothetical protein
VPLKSSHTQLDTITAKASSVDQVTQNVFGVTRGPASTDSKITSNLLSASLEA